DGDDLRVQVDGLGRAGREDGNPPALKRLERPQSEVDRDYRYVLQLPNRLELTIAEDDDEVGDQDAVGIQVRGRVLAGPHDEDATVGSDRRNRGAAPVEDDDVGLAFGGEARPLGDVGLHD